MSLLFAATYPQRVRGLVLYASYGSGSRALRTSRLAANGLSGSNDARFGLTARTYRAAKAATNQPELPKAAIRSAIQAASFTAPATSADPSE
jgi:pimeloyl-ACP methyl ester carboxylesterase